jgi:hypothetical protein
MIPGELPPRVPHGSSLVELAKEPGKSLPSVFPQDCPYVKLTSTKTTATISNSFVITVFLISFFEKICGPSPTAGTILITKTTPELRSYCSKDQSFDEEFSGRKLWLWIPIL